MDKIEVGQVLKWTGLARTVVLRIDKITITPGIAKVIDQRNFAVMVLLTRWACDESLSPEETDPHILNTYLDTLLYWVGGDTEPWEVLKGEEAAKYLNYKPVSV